MSDFLKYVEQKAAASAKMALARQQLADIDVLRVANMGILVQYCRATMTSFNDAVKVTEQLASQIPPEAGELESGVMNNSLSRLKQEQKMYGDNLKQLANDWSRLQENAEASRMRAEEAFSTALSHHRSFGMIQQMERERERS